MRTTFLIVTLLAAVLVVPARAQHRPNLPAASPSTAASPSIMFNSAAALAEDDGISKGQWALIGGLTGAYVGAVIGAIATLNCTKYCPIYGLVGGAIGAVVGAVLIAGDNSPDPLVQPRRTPLFRLSFGL